VHDTRLDPDYVHGFTDDLPQLLSELTVPIKSGDVVTGLINLQCAETNAFSEEDQAKVEMLALYISAALDLIREARHHREAEEMYRGLLDSTMEGVVVVQGMTYVYVNAEYTRILGYDSPAELIGVNILDTVAPEYRSLVETRTISRQSGESQPSRYSIQLLRRDGAKIDAELNIALIEFNDVPANLTSVRDMTEQKWMEGEIRNYSARLEKALVERTRSLSESEAKYRALVDNLHEGILTLDAFEHTTFANPRMAEMLGYTVEEMLGRHVTDFIAPDHIDVYLNGTKRRRTSGSEQYDIELVRKDGNIITVTVGTSPLNGENGEYVGSIAGVVDVTEKRRLESQLRESERQASVGRIASMVGHDLRTPLQTVKSAVALMKRRPKMTDEALKTIDEAVDYSVRMLEDLRGVSGGMSPIREGVYLGDLVTEAVARAPLQSVDVELALGGEPVLVSIDSTMMSRVFDNLIKNASEAMPSGGSLKITMGEENGEVFIEVRDSGVGIAPARMGELFQTFYTTKSNGLGLGLVYCKKAVEAHGGRIEVKSEPDVGSTFRVCLPLGLVRGRLASSVAP
jgi:PAS domain S-box-containing protein